MHWTTWHIPKGFLLNFHGHHNFHICVLNFVHLFHLKRKFKKCFLLFSAFSLITLSLSLLPSISIYWAISFLLKVFLYRLVSSDLPEIFFFFFSCSASMGRDPGSSPCWGLFFVICALESAGSTTSWEKMRSFLNE